METYIMLTKLTDQGRKTLKEKPKRTQEVNKEVEAMGGKVVAQYAVLGPYDFVCCRRLTTKPSPRSRWSSGRGEQWRS